VSESVYDVTPVKLVPSPTKEPVYVIGVVEIDELNDSFAATLLARDELNDVEDPDISVAICAELDIKVLLSSDSAVVNLVLIEELAAVNEPEISDAICADEDNNAGVFDKLLKSTEPETIWPPFATTTLPVVALSSTISTELVVEVVIDCGIIMLSLLSYTCTITFLVPKLCVTVDDVTEVKVSETVAVCEIDIPVNPDPSPVKDPVNADAVTALSTLRDANSGLLPESAIFFQFGIIYSLRLVTLSSPLPPNISTEANKCLI